MDWRLRLGRGLIGTACVLVLAILAFLFLIGPSTGWSRSARIAPGKEGRSVSAKAPLAVRVAYNGALVAAPVSLLLGYLLIRSGRSGRPP